MEGIFSAVKEMISASTIAGSPMHILDIGGESTKPGAFPVEFELERSRTIPVIHALRQQQWFNESNVLISIDTSKSELAREAVLAGANLINDVTAGSDSLMFDVALEMRVPLILMHSRGTPLTMRDLKEYKSDQFESEEDLIHIVSNELNEKIELALKKGIYPWQLITDVGIGFAKNQAQNLSLLRNLTKWNQCVGNFPLLVGPSRKGFLGTLINEPDPTKRVMATAASVSTAIMNGANILRVHDVREIAQLVTVLNAIQRKDNAVLLTPNEFEMSCGQKTTTNIV